MQRLRSIHLYLGCFFAPLLLFFAVSGIWQMLGWGGDSHLLALLSTIHTSHRPKFGRSLASPWLTIFVFLMAVGFITTTVLGIAIALKFGKSRRAALWCLVTGVLIPLGMIAYTALAR